MDITALHSLDIQGIRQDLRDISTDIRDFATQRSNSIMNIVSKMDLLIRGIQKIGLEIQEQQKDSNNKGHENDDYMEIKQEDEIIEDSPMIRPSEIDFLVLSWRAVEFIVISIQAFGSLPGSVGDNWVGNAGWNGKSNVHFIIWQDELSSGGGIT